MNSQRLILMVRLLIAGVLGFFLIRYAKSAMGHGDITAAFFVGALVAGYGIVLFFLFGFSFIGKVAERFGNFYEPPDSNFQIIPEYSVAEARVNKGKYQEAVDEYRKVIVAHPDDVYPHLRIADLALKHLNDVKLAELELQSALGKATGEDTTALAAGRLADFYQHTLHDVARALEVMKQLREKIPGTKQAKLAEERIATLERLVGGESLPPATPGKIAPRPSRYKMPE
jgi:tetratricopeptide (TPR) repeat protein